MKMSKDKEIHNLKEQIRYWKNKFEYLQKDYIKLENYKRGMIDALYYTSPKRRENDNN